MELKDKKCLPCSTYVSPLSLEEKKNFLKSIDAEWKLIHHDSRLLRSFKFKNFKRALGFTNEIGRIAEEEQHHPEIHLGWGHSDVQIWTHTNNDLLENDFILAAKLDEAFLKLSTPKL